MIGAWWLLMNVWWIRGLSLSSKAIRRRLQTKIQRKTPKSIRMEELQRKFPQLQVSTLAILCWIRWQVLVSANCLFRSRLSMERTIRFWQSTTMLTPWRRIGFGSQSLASRVLSNQWGQGQAVSYLVHLLRHSIKRLEVQSSSLQERQSYSFSNHFREQEVCIKRCSPRLFSCMTSSHGAFLKASVSPQSRGGWESSISHCLFILISQAKLKNKKSPLQKMPLELFRRYLTPRLTRSLCNNCLLNQVRFAAKKGKARLILSPRSKVFSKNSREALKLLRPRLSSKKANLCSTRLLIGVSLTGTFSQQV